MNELANRDGVLASLPSNPNQFALTWEVGKRESETDKLSAEVAETFVSDEHIGVYQIVGRSMLAIAGMDIRQADGQSLEVDGRLFVPIDVDAHTELSHAMLNRFRQLQADKRPGDDPRIRWNGQQLGIGNVLHNGSLERLDGEQIQRAIDEKIIWIDDESSDRPTGYQVTDESLMIDMASWLLDLDEAAIMADEKNILNLILHGRRAFGVHTDIDRPNGDSPHGRFAVRAALFAPGNLTAQVLGTNDPGLIQLPSGAWIHANRFMGTDKRMSPQARGQQIELLNRGTDIAWADAQAEIAFYQPKREERIKQAVQPIVDLEALQPERRAHLQQKGYDLLSLVARRDIYQTLGQSLDAGNCALVITPNGITEVPNTKYDSRNARHVLNAAISSGTVRTVPEHLSELGPFIEKLGMVANNPRVVVADRLLLEDIPEIVNKGDVQAVIVRDFGSPFMSQQTHTAIVELAKQGITIAWDHDGDIRKMHRSGFWMTSENIERFEKLEFVYAFYGTHMDEIVAGMEEDYETSFDIMSGIMPTRYVGVTNGGGPGAMAAANKYGGLQDMMRMAVMIDVESKGQGGYRHLTEGHFGVGSDFRTYRQTTLDQTRDGSITSTGGSGSIEETTIGVVTTKLHDALPFPIVTSAPDNLYGPLKKVYERSSNIHLLNPKGKTAFELSKPLTQAWVSRMIFNTPTLVEAAQIYRRFWENPKAMWGQAMIPKAELESALAKRLIVADRIGRRVSPYIIDAVNSYRDPSDLPA